VIAAQLHSVLVGSPSVAKIGEGLNEPKLRIAAFTGRRSWNVGCFRVTAFPSVHSSPDRWEGEITSALHTPVGVDAYRNGGTFSYLFERDGLKILVHPSASVQPGMYVGQTADVVFLGVGQLGVKDPPAVEALWREVVSETHARTVYLIHWDNLTRTLDRPLTPVPWPLDNFALTRRRLDGLMKADGFHAKIERPTLFGDITLWMKAPRSACSPGDAGRFEAVG